jgi:hypothetical protein
VLGNKLYTNANHGDKPKTDKIDSHQIAVLLRGSMLPQAYVYPKGVRETCELLRRRTFLVRCRVEALVHLSNTNSQYNPPSVELRIGAGSRLPDTTNTKSETRNHLKGVWELSSVLEPGTPLVRASKVASAAT